MFELLLIKAIRSTLDQQAPSIDPTTVVCRYRYTPRKGIVFKCPVGHLIEDELGSSSEEMLKALCAIQTCHDAAAISHIRDGVGFTLRFRNLLSKHKSVPVYCKDL